MSTAEAIYEKAKALPNELQVEALDFVNFLHSQRQAQREAAEWANFSAVSFCSTTRRRMLFTTRTEQ